MRWWVYSSVGGTWFVCHSHRACNSLNNLYDPPAMSILNTLTIAQLTQAISIKEQIAGLENDLASIFGSATSTVVVAKPSPATKAAPAAKPAKQGMSEESRAKIAAAATARWAKIKAAKAKPVTAPKVVVKSAPAKPTAKPVKQGMSEEGRARIVAAQKARWAIIKAAEAKSVVKSAPAKVTAVSEPVKKWKISAEGMAKIKAAAKAYWAKKKAGEK